MSKRSRSESSLLPQEEPLSQALLPVPDKVALVLCAPSAERDTLVSALLRIGLQPLPASSVAEAPTAAAAPSLCVLEWSLPDAAAYLEQLTSSSRGFSPLVIVRTREESAAAYAAGAAATLTAPVTVEEVAACLRSHRDRRVRQQLSDAASEQSQRVSAATAFEAVLRAVGQELRIPLATALANVEYLVEVAQSPGSPLSEEENLAITTDTLEALQRVRTALEGLSVLIQKDAPVLEPVRLWRVAQRVIDELPNGARSVELQGDIGLRGWGDESTLVEVTSTLVKRAISRQAVASGPRVSLHVYAHDTEARLTVRELGSEGTRRRTSDDPFCPGRLTRTGAHSGLELVAARHAIVRMGGKLSYVAQHEAGCAFRVRLKLAQPATP